MPVFGFESGELVFKAVCTLANAGLLKGIPAGLPSRRPGDESGICHHPHPVRAGGRMRGRPVPDIGKHWAHGNINYAASKGWIEGYEDGDVPAR